MHCEIGDTAHYTLIMMTKSSKRRTVIVLIFLLKFFSNPLIIMLSNCVKIKFQCPAALSWSVIV